MPFTRRSQRNSCLPGRTGSSPCGSILLSKDSTIRHATATIVRGPGPAPKTATRQLALRIAFP